jgi:CubicO group peptidase (beta-lactamase class C family)/glyoxylase-like metal-dependent hydrolase (beta-lactamase superfamily II)
LLPLLFAYAAAAAEQPFPAHRVVGNVYYVGSDALATYLITTPEGHILINSGFEETVPLIQASVESLGFKMTDVKILLESHAHSDHVVGHARLQQITGAKVYVMRGDHSVIASGGQGQYLYADSRWTPCKVDRVLDDGDEVKLGGETLVAHSTPGHTAGCTTWAWQATDGGKKYDVVVIGSPNVNPGYRLVRNKDYPQIASDFARTFAVLKKLPCDVFLGAHGEYYGMRAKYDRLKKADGNPFIDPKGYQAYVAEKEQVFRAKLADQRTEEAKGISAALQPYIDRQELAGAVTLVADKNQVLSHAAVGFADIGKKLPMQPDSLFWIASQSKPITAAALMMLVDDGKVKVDDAVEKYLPEFRGQMVAEKDGDHVLLKEPKRPITVKDVLSHTSGLPFSSPLEQPTLDRLPLADRVRSYAKLPLDFEPGTKYKYSNAGINTAGRIVEVVSGMSFDRFLDERLLRPLGMNDTTFWPDEAQAARIAKSYRPGANGSGLEETTVSQLQYPLIDRMNRFPMPAGGLFSSAADLAKFYQMLAGGGQLNGRRFLSEEAVKQMTSRQTPADLSDNYGFGFSTGGDRIGHGGAYSTNSYIDTKNGLIFIWLVQHAGFPGKGGESQEAFRRAVLDSTAK